MTTNESAQHAEFEAKHPGCCPRCGWSLSSHMSSQYGLDCPWGSSPAAKAGDLPAQLARRESAPDPMAGEGCVPCGTCGGDQTRGWHLHDRPATPPADHASERERCASSHDGHPCGVCDASTEASEPLTEAEREALWSGLRRARHEDAPVPLVHEQHKIHVLWAVTPAVERIVAAREAAAATKARADERERIAQAIEAERDRWDARFPVPEGWDLEYILRRAGTYSGLDRAARIARGDA